MPLAKCLVIAVVITVASLVVHTAVIAAGNVVFGLHDMPTASLADRDTIRAIVGLTLVGFVFPVIGVAVAFMLRSSAAAITAVLALLFLPTMFGPLLPDRWQRDVLAWLPGPLTDSASIGFLSTDSVMTKGVWVSVVGLIVWLVIFVGGAWVLINRRDA
jgi:ABC-type transport system involved in multi-copper enzyme maturation permease subunit